MKEHPILFCADMVRAYLAGHKWQTRRVIKLPRWSTETWSDFELDDEDCPVIVDYKTGCLTRIPCPYGQPSDTLWVCETWQARSPVGLEWNRYKVIERNGYMPSDWEIRYAATDENFAEWSGWNPSIFMPRWASRISFPIVSIRAERVQDISENDAFAEGYPSLSPYQKHGGPIPFPRKWYHTLWDSINAKHGFPWDTNPWVWVVEFPKYEVIQ